MADAARPGGTYRTLDEQREVLSPAEERFERARQTLELFIGPLAFLAMYFAPLPLEPAQQTLAAILTFTIVYWLSKAVPIPVTAVLALAMCVVFGVAVALWILPGVLALLLGQEAAAYGPVSDRLDEGTVILFGSGIALGTLLSSTGLAETIGNGVANTLGFSSLLAVSAVSALIAILISETTSNTASATIVVPIVISIAAAAGLDPIIPALAAVFGASFGFMMPVSTPQNAVVYGSGMIPTTKMVRSGVVFDVVGIVLIVALIPIMARLTGLA